MAALWWFVMLTMARGEDASPRVRTELQESIPILAWWSIPHSHANSESYREMAEAGFTHCLPPDRGREENLEHLRLADEVGIKVVVQDRRLFRDPEAVAQDYKDKPALWAYHLKDEPGADEFPRLRGVLERLSAVDPDHMGYINLLPTYAENKLLQADGYEDYLERYLETVKPFVLSYDNYVIDGNAYREREFFRNLWIIRDRALKHELPFWAFVMVTAHGPYPEPEEGDIRFQAFSSLAYGARGIQYFTYWTPTGRPDHRFRRGPMDPTGKRNPVYEHVKRVNWDVHAFAPVLVELTSVGVYLSPPLPNGEASELHSGSLPASVEAVSGDSVLLGSFQDDEQAEYLFVVNRSPRHAARVGLKFTEQISAVREIPESVRDYAPVSLGPKQVVVLELAPGDGRMLKIEGKEE